jgi:sphingomyelin phosphodiesterase
MSSKGRALMASLAAAVTCCMMVLAASQVEAHATTKIVLREDGFRAIDTLPTTRPSAADADAGLPSPPAVLPSNFLQEIYEQMEAQAVAFHHPSLGRPSLYAQLDNANSEIAARAQLNLNCTVCEAAVTLIEPILQKNSTQLILETVAIFVCELMKPLCYNPAACVQVCTGIVGEYLPVVEVLERELLTPVEVCALLKQCPAPPQPSPSTAIPVPSNLENLAGEVDWPSWSETTGTGTFLHLSDAHMDTTYTPGSLAGCALPVCCHASDGPGTNASDTAGYWGDHRCDTSLQLAQNVLDYIATLSPDFIIYTGDDPAHDVWKQSRTENLAALALWSSLLNTTVGGPNRIPIFSALGNHEIFPINQFAGPGFDSWLYDAAVAAWAPNLPEDAQATLAYGGYYQARVRPGLRVVSLNSNYFTKDNFWLLGNQTDAEDQLNWIADVLSQATALNEKVIVICHHPLLSWDSKIATAFLTIAEQYQTTIVNYFFGHTHFNGYSALHNADGKPMHVTYTGGSIVPYSYINPGYMEYGYDRQAVANNATYSYLVQSAHAHWLSLEQANTANDTDTQWPLLRWDMQTGLGVETLDPATLFDLAPEYITNATLYAQFLYTQSKDLPQSSPDSAKQVRCATASNLDQEYHDCMHAAGFSEEQIQAKEAEEKC